ncbi:MAG: beta-ketoacyl-ACP synthase II [Anaerolineae bacterium]|nr:beta-ketoacyl-ACP synthase II [Anaerolineae bacterium]
MNNTRRRVVITGLGAVTPLGLTVADTWAGLVAGRSGVDYITLFDASSYPIRIAGEVKGFDAANYIGFKEAKRMARCSHLSVAAGLEAMADAGLGPLVPEPERSGTIMGVGAGGWEVAMAGIDALRTKGLSRVNPFALPASLPNMPAHHLSLLFQCQGYNGTVVTACAAGTQAIGEATEVIRRGAADLMLTGGAEALINEISFAGFIAMRALAAENDPPEKACKPFDARHDGFIISEGSAVLVLESLEHALARGAHIYVEVIGYAACTDAFHVAQPDPEGIGAARTIHWALENAGIAPEEIDCINSHGPGTPLGDIAETKAIKRVLGDHAYRVPVQSTKSMIGHAFGGAGAIEGMVCVKTICEGIIHPTINFETPDPECDLDYVPNQARRVDVRTVLSNSFGLGGQNACLVFRRYES